MLLSNFQLRQKLYANNYRPVAIPSGLKFPIDVAWPDLARRDPPYDCTHPVDPHRPGTGILCDGLRPIDIDIEDAAKVSAVAEYCADHFGPAPVRYRANSPRLLLLYAATEGEPSKASCKNKDTDEAVEILGRGNQFFAFGMHPSGAPLLWQDGPDVVARADLVKITDDQTSELLAFCADLIDADRVNHRRWDEVMPIRALTGEEWPLIDIADALLQIPTSSCGYDEWLRIGAAVYDASGGSEEGCQLFSDWSVNDGTNGARKLFHGFHANQLWQITAGTLTHHARQWQPDWERPSTHGFVPLNIFRKKGIS